MCSYRLRMLAASLRLQLALPFSPLPLSLRKDLYIHVTYHLVLLSLSIIFQDLKVKWPTASDAPEQTDYFSITTDAFRQRQIIH